MKTFFSSLFAPFLPNTRMPADKKTYSKTCFSNPPKMEIFFQNLLFAINQRYKKQIIQYFKILQKCYNWCVKLEIFKILLFLVS